MELYAVYDVDDGYEGHEWVSGLFFKEVNARKELETLKERNIAIRQDSRYKRWWVEEPLDAYRPDTIIAYRLHDSMINWREDHHTDQLLEIRVLKTGDEPDAIGLSTDAKSKAKATKKPPKTEED